MRKLKNPWVHLSEYQCFGCSPKNNAGVKMTFYEDGDEIVSVWKPESHFQGWHNTLHGGIQTLLMDEIAGWVVSRKLQTAGVTSKIEIKFKKPLYTTDKFMIIRGSISEIKRNIVIINTSIHNSENELCAEAECIYFTFNKEKAKEMHFTECGVENDEVTMNELISQI